MGEQRAHPVFSIVSMIKNIGAMGDQFVRSVESVLNQSFQELEFIVQDGGSSDNTNEIISKFGDRRMKVSSESDSCSAEGFFRALKRCRGKYIGFCFSDEELAPNALEIASKVFLENPGISAFYGNYGSVNEGGEKWGPHIPGYPFSVEGYVCQRLVPPLCSSFFSRRHLEQAALHTHQWRYQIGEFELWIRAANTGSILYYPALLSFFGRHFGSDTATAQWYDSSLANRARAMPELFEENPILRNSMVSVSQAIAGNYVWGAISVRGIEGESVRFKEYIRTALNLFPSSLYMWDLINSCSDEGFRQEMQAIALSMVQKNLIPK